MCLNTKKVEKSSIDKFIKIKAGQYMWSERFNKEFKEESKEKRQMKKSKKRV